MDRIDLLYQLLRQRNFKSAQIEFKLRWTAGSHQHRGRKWLLSDERQGHGDGFQTMLARQVDIGGCRS